jgi:hypothetical protein
MTYRLVVDGSMFSRKGVFNDNLLTATLNTSSINAFGNPNTNLFSIGNYTKTVNIGSATTIINYTGTHIMNGPVTVNGDATFNGAFNFNGTFIYPNSFDFKTNSQNISFGYNQNAGTTINLGNQNIPTLNTNIYGNTTQIAINNNNFVEANSITNYVYLDFHSCNTAGTNYDGRISCNGGNSTTAGQGTMSIITNTLNLPNTIKANNTGNSLNLFTNQTNGGTVTIGSTNANTILQGSDITLPNNISSTNKGSTVGLFTDQTTGGNVTIGSTSANTTVQGASIVLSNNISSTNKGSTVGLFTDQTTGGNITIGSNSINTFIRGINLSTPNQLGSININQNVSLFTDQSITNSTNIYYGVPRKTSHILRSQNTYLSYNTSSITGVSPCLEMYASGDWSGIDFHSSDASMSDYDARIITYSPTTPGSQGTSNMALMAKNIGIGTTTPAYTLDINGKTNFQDIVSYSFNNNSIYNNATIAWVKLGNWTAPATNGGYRLKLIIFGDNSYDNGGNPLQGTMSGNEVIIFATMLNNANTANPNINVKISISNGSNLPLSKIIFAQNGTNRYSYDIYGYFNTYTQTYIIPLTTYNSTYTSYNSTGTTPSTTPSSTNFVFDVQNPLNVDNVTGKVNINGEVKIQAAISYGSLTLSPTTNSGEAAIGFYQNPSKGGKIWSIGTGGTGGFADDSFGIFSSTLAATTNGTVIMCKPSGNVGIGTTTPAYNLDVNGTVNCNSLRVNSFSNFLTTQTAEVTTTTNVTMRAFATNYRNSGTTPIFITCTVWAKVANETFEVYADSSSSPTTKIISLIVYSNYGTLTFIVLPSYYYRLTRSNSGEIRSWCQWS